MNNKRILVNLYEDNILYDIVYHQQHKSRDSNACHSVRSKKKGKS